jgi:hypothetical protein
MTDRDREFRQYYEVQRIENQLAWYKKTARFHAGWDNRFVILSGILMFTASVGSWVVAAGWAGAGPLAVWLIVAALAPALSAAVAATRVLYGNENNRERYENTALDLQTLSAYRAPTPTMADAEYREALVEYVTAVESLLTQEHQQWVQTMGEVARTEPPE